MTFENSAKVRKADWLIWKLKSARDYVIDMGPGGGEAGGRVVCAGTPQAVAGCPGSVTGGYLRG